MTYKSNKIIIALREMDEIQEPFERLKIALTGMAVDVRFFSTLVHLEQMRHQEALNDLAELIVDARNTGFGNSSYDLPEAAAARHEGQNRDIAKSIFDDVQSEVTEIECACAGMEPTDQELISAVQRQFAGRVEHGVADLLYQAREQGFDGEHYRVSYENS